MGVGLGLIVFTCFIVLVIWAYDKIGTMRKDRDIQTRQRQALEDARREVRLQRSAAQAGERTIHRLRAELAKLHKKQRHRASLWASLHRFGRHGFECPKHENQNHPSPCNCGLDAALKEQP